MPNALPIHQARPTERKTMKIFHEERFLWESEYVLSVHTRAEAYDIVRDALQENLQYMVGNGIMGGFGLWQDHHCFIIIDEDYILISF